MKWLQYILLIFSIRVHFLFHFIKNFFIICVLFKVYLVLVLLILGFQLNQKRILKI